MNVLAVLVPILFALILLWLVRGFIRDFIFALIELGKGTRRGVVIEASPPRLRAKEGEEPLPLDEAPQVIARIGPQRRKMLKLFGLGAGAFVLGKVVGPSLSWFPHELISTTFNFKNFRVVERGKELAFYDRDGNEILILEADV